MRDDASLVMITTFQLKRPFIAHPAVVFAAVWVITLGLTVWEVVPVFAQYAETAVILSLILIICVLIGAVLAALITSGSRQVQAGVIRYRTAILLTVWSLITIFEIVNSGGLPIIWLLTGSGRTYEEFGIPTLHGFANALWLYLTFATFIRCQEQQKSWRVLLLLAILLLWPLLVVSRGLFTINLFQLVFFYFLTTNTRVHILTLRLLLLALAFVFAFGFAGDARAPDFSIEQSLGFDAGEAHFATLLWVYSYIVSPISTLALNWENTIPQMNLLPTNTFQSLLPTVVRSAIEMKTGFEGYQGVLAHDAFNVSTAFLSPFLDWGVAGMLLMALLIGFFGHIIWKSALRNAHKIPLLCTFDTFVALTIFTNQFTGLTSLLLLFLLAYLTRSIQLR